VMVAEGGGGGENSDEYWNALIDGMSHERTEKRVRLMIRYPWDDNHD
jgi:hypothetical protein